MKKAYIVILILCFSLLFCNVSFAYIIDEVEPNNTSEEAQIIERNQHNAFEMGQGKFTSQRVVAGSVYNDYDADWYIVNLPADDNTVLSINHSVITPLFFEVYDENLNLVQGVEHYDDPMFIGAQPYYVNIPMLGDYYVKVSANTYGNEIPYKFTIGSPNYSVGSYEYQAQNACTLTQIIDSVQDTYDLTDIDAIPDGAIASGVTIRGQKTNSAFNEARSIKLESDWSWITTRTFTWNADIPVTKSKFTNKLIKSRWVFKLDGDVYRPDEFYSLIPEIRFSYVYPRLP